MLPCRIKVAAVSPEASGVFIACAREIAIGAVWFAIAA
jgi:hypothetical protein